MQTLHPFFLPRCPLRATSVHFIPHPSYSHLLTISPAIEDYLSLREIESISDPKKIRL